MSSTRRTRWHTTHFTFGIVALPLPHYEVAYQMAAHIGENYCALTPFNDRHQTPDNLHDSPRTPSD